MTESWVNDENALGHLVGYGVRHALCPNDYLAKSAIASLRQLWPKIEPYFRREIICTIEVALLRAEDKPIALVDEWRELRDELRGPKAAFTVDYRCGRCDGSNLKLWRGVHGCKSKDGHELLCARCLAPDVTVDETGMAQEPGKYGMHTDQIGGWLPAIPVDDTYWSYASVPSQDVDWWQALPTYAVSPPSSEESK